MRRAAVLGFGVLALAGCGSSSAGSGPSARDVAAQLARAVRAHDAGSRLADATCVKRTDREYVCQGDYRPSRAMVTRSLNGISTNGWTAGDWAVMTRRISGAVTYQVTVDPSDGSFIYQPE